MTPTITILYSTTGLSFVDASSLSYLQSDYATLLTVDTADYTLGGTTVYIQQVTDYGSSMTATSSMQLTFADPCPTTSFDTATISSAY
jgi:hypothetical protein